MASKTAICNLALSHLGIAKEIANIETEISNEASACRRFFDTTNEETLADFPWPFATRFRVLALLFERPAETGGEWGFSYRFPSDAFRIRRVLSGIRNDNRQTRVSYRVAQDDTAKIIYTDQRDAIVEYTLRQTNTELFTADYTIAFSYLLAHYIGPRLTGGDPTKIKERMFALYKVQIEKSQDSSLNEEQADEEPESEMVRLRE